LSHFYSTTNVMLLP